MTKRKRERKKLKGTEPTATDFYDAAKEIQNRSGSAVGSGATEDRRFRDYFGCSVIVALLAWNLMVTCGHLPADGTIAHFLWALHFMKVYPKQDEGSAVAGGSGGAMDPKTWRKYSWPMIYALSLLEQHVVRELFYFCCHFCFRQNLTQRLAADLCLADNFRSENEGPSTQQRLPVECGRYRLPHSKFG